MKNIKKFIPLLVIIGVLVGGYYWFFTDKGLQKKQQTEIQESVSESDLLADELAHKYNAVTNWAENSTYTLDVQERIATGEPVLFRGYVDDIFNRDGEIFVRFSSSFISPLNYMLELECNRSVVDKILAESIEEPLKLFEEYAMVASIRDVSKPVFALEGSSLSEDEVEIDIESSGLFTANGTCIDVVYIGENKPFKD